MTRKNGFGQFLEARRKKTPSKISTSFSSSEWEVLLSSLKEEVTKIFFYLKFYFSILFKFSSMLVCVKIHLSLSCFLPTSYLNQAKLGFLGYCFVSQSFLRQWYTICIGFFASTMQNPFIAVFS